MRETDSMFLLLVVVATELTLLYFLSQWLMKKLYLFVYLVSLSKSVAISATSLVFFPGTVVHELSHLFVAEILGVRTGKLTLVPEAVRPGEIQAGSVMIAHTDPVRRYAIGLAPIVVGLTLLSAISFYIPGLIENAKRSLSEGTVFDPSVYLAILILYALFALSNTMFSSKQDLQGFGAFAVVVLIVLAAAYIAGLRLTLVGTTLAGTVWLLTTMAKSVFFVIILNGILLILTSFSIYLATKILHRYIRETLP